MKQFSFRRACSGVRTESNGGINIPRLRIVVAVSVGKLREASKWWRRNTRKPEFACEFSANRAPHECSSSLIGRVVKLNRGRTLGGEFESNQSP